MKNEILTLARIALISALALSMVSTASAKEVLPTKQASSVGVQRM